MGVKVKEDLLTIKDVIRKPVQFRQAGDEADQIYAQLNALTEKVDEMHDKLLSEKDNPATLKRKKQIIAALQEAGYLSATALGQKLQLSRTRSSEYLNKLVDEGIIESFTKGRKKYFRVIDQ